VHTFEHTHLYVRIVAQGLMIGLAGDLILISTGILVYRFGRLLASALKHPHPKRIANIKV
jgi:hypothetical protein